MQAAFICATDRRRSAFTLVELLVVIGIIALLISILMPALNQAREQSNRTVCLSNLRELAMAMTMYTGDNQGKLPILWPGSDDWTATNDVLIALNEIYVKSPATFHCPSDTDPVQQQITSGDFIPNDSARTSYDFYSVWWEPQFGPKLVRLQGPQGLSDMQAAPLAWDLNVNPAATRVDGQNHGPTGGNVVYADSHADWQPAADWDKLDWPHPASIYYNH